MVSLTEGTGEAWAGRKVVIRDRSSAPGRRSGRVLARLYMFDIVEVAVVGDWLGLLIGSVCR